MKKSKLRLIDKEDLYYAGRLWRMRFEAPGIEADPGMFVNIAVGGHYLRRPISVSEYDGEVLSLIIQTVGDGTRRLVSAAPGTYFDMLTGLGNTFSLPAPGEHRQVILIGGGVGYAPLVGLLKKLCRETDAAPFAVFGFTTEADVPLRHLEELRDEGYPFEYCTLSGEMGDNGNAIEVMEEYIDVLNLSPEYFYACGPMGMMKAVCRAFDFGGELSLEARMGCGFGACMGCSVMTAEGPRRICKEGPVFTKNNLLLQ